MELLCFLGLFVGSVWGMEVSNLELQQIADSLWAFDANAAKANQMRLDYQGRTSISARVDKAPKALFASLDSGLLRRPTYRTLRDLYAFYKPQTGKRETSSRAKAAAQEKFLDAVLRTDVMAQLGGFLKFKGYRGAATKADFKRVLQRLWFEGYSRARGVMDSSGFEHVFLGEFKEGEISGLHSWLRIAEWEKSGGLDYTGYIYHTPSFVSAQLRSGRRWKNGASFLLGRSPEYDMAIYTLCYLARRGKKRCRFTLPDCTEIRITTFELKQRGREHIGTAYPDGHRLKDCKPRDVERPIQQPKKAGKLGEPGKAKSWSLKNWLTSDGATLAKSSFLFILPFLCFL